MEDGVNPAANRKLEAVYHLSNTVQNMVRAKEASVELWVLPMEEGYLTIRLQLEQNPVPLFEFLITTMPVCLFLHAGSCLVQVETQLIIQYLTVLKKRLTSSIGEAPG
ncbi:hypothetical protein S245_016065 [Arachis hypogaea]